MATHLSQQMNQIAEPNYTPLKANEWGGRVRIAWFEWDNATDNATPGGTFAQNDYVTLGILPAGARILHGRVYFGDFGTSVTADIGLFATDGTGYITTDGSTTADDEDWLGAAIDVATAAGASDFANTAALHMGYVLEKECYLRAKFEGGNPIDTTCVFNGYVLYVTD